MIKIYNVRGFKITFKTTVLVNGKCFFSGRNMDDIVEEATRLGVASINTQTTTEQSILLVFSQFVKLGVVPVEIEHRGFIYQGDKMKQR
jgi:hypothetical protein